MSTLVRFEPDRRNLGFSSLGPGSRTTVQFEVWVIVAGHSFLCRNWRWNLDSSTEEGRFLLVAIVVHVDLLWVQGVRVRGQYSETGSELSKL